jgi:hypothetical protein
MRVLEPLLASRGLASIVACISPRRRAESSSRGSSRPASAPGRSASCSSSAAIIGGSTVPAARPRGHRPAPAPAPVHEAGGQRFSTGRRLEVAGRTTTPGHLEARPFGGALNIMLLTNLLGGAREQPASLTPPKLSGTSAPPACSAATVALLVRRSATFASRAVASASGNGSGVASRVTRSKMTAFRPLRAVTPALPGVRQAVALLGEPLEFRL